MTAPPLDGAANVALIRAIAAWPDVPPSAVRLVAGHRSRIKVVEVEDLPNVPPASERH